MTDLTKDWMMMPSGKHVYPLHVKLDDINIDDMAHNLGQICRYNGGVDEFYSVAEHSSGIARALRRDGAPPIVQLQALVHDGPEYIMGDMIRPLKNALALEVPAAAAFLKRVDRDIAIVISEKYSLPHPDDFDPRVKEYDDRIVNDEKAFLFGERKPWTHGGKPLGIEIECWEPKKARRKFRFHFYSLMQELGR